MEQHRETGVETWETKWPSHLGKQTPSKLFKPEIGKNKQLPCPVVKAKALALSFSGGVQVSALTTELDPRRNSTPVKWPMILFSVCPLKAYQKLLPLKLKTCAQKGRGENKGINGGLRVSIAQMLCYLPGLESSFTVSSLV